MMASSSSSSSSSPSFPFHIKTHLLPTQHIRDFARATSTSQEDVLHLQIKQYIPKDNPDPQPGDVTIIGAHANGFPKELYEPLWADLHALASASGTGPGSGFRIRGIWIADVADQGYSGTVNEPLLGDEPSWDDHARDLLHMTNAFRQEMPRPLVGVGHSFGGAQLTRLALLHPRLLTTLVLLDPTITRFTFRGDGPGASPAKSSTHRRDVWPSRHEAAASFRRNRFYTAWDPRVLDRWVEHALRETPTALVPADAGAGVTLRTTKHQEVFTYFRPLHMVRRDDGSYAVDRETAPDFDPALFDPIDPQAPFPFYRTEGPRVLRDLPHVRPSVLWVFGATSDLSKPADRALKTSTCGVGGGGSGGREAGKVAEVVMEGRGHLFPMEVPDQCARHAAAWIGREVAAWRDEERRYREWAALSLREKSTLGPEFMRRIGPPASRTTTKKDGEDGDDKREKKQTRGESKL